MPLIPQINCDIYFKMKAIITAGSQPKEPADGYAGPFCLQSKKWEFTNLDEFLQSERVSNSTASAVILNFSFNLLSLFIQKANSVFSSELPNCKTVPNGRISILEKFKQF